MPTPLAAPQAGPPGTLQPAPPVVLVSDHRGSGLWRSLRGLAEVGFALEVSTSLRETLGRLSGGAGPSVLLLDPLAAVGTGELDALAGAAGPESEPPPVLVVGDSATAEGLLAGLRQAGLPTWDLVDRAAPVIEFGARLERLVEQDRLRREMERLRHSASHDDRTDLLRPRTFEARLLEHFSAAQRHGLDLALMLVDLDKFGQINKRHDHTVGDELIERVGQAVRRTLRTEDVAGRLGGDEFAVLLPYTRKGEAARVADRLLDEIRRVVAKDGVAITGSLGFETFDGRDLESVEALREHAERALRAAKRQGGNGGVYFRALGTRAE